MTNIELEKKIKELEAIVMQLLAWKAQKELQQISFPSR